MDRRIKKIENVCHCKIKIDTINPNVCKTLLKGYHLFEIYYDENKGNHTGCMHMLEGLLGDNGHIQAVVTITKSKEGRILRSNFLSEAVSYSLYHNSVHQDPEVISKKSTEILGDLNAKDSKKFFEVIEKQNIACEILEEEVTNIENSSNVPKRSFILDDDKLFQTYLVTKPFNYDSQEYGVLVKENHLESVDSCGSDVESLGEEIIPNKTRNTNVEYKENYSSDEDFISMLSNCSSNLSSSSSSLYEDAISKSRENLSKNYVDGYAICHDILDMLDYETLKNSNVINQVINEIGKECFEEFSRALKGRILKDVNNIKFATTQYCIRTIDDILSKHVSIITEICITSDIKLWKEIQKVFFAVLDGFLCFNVQIINEDLFYRIIKKKMENNMIESKLPSSYCDDFSSFFDNSSQENVNI